MTHFEFNQASDPKPDSPQPDLPPPGRPAPGTPNPGDPPSPPRPHDPPPPSPKPDTPRPVEPGLVFGALLLLLLTLAKPALAVPRDNPIDDNDILAAIETDLRFDDAVSADMIEVDVDAGVVTITGASHTLFGRRRAERLVASLKGVRSIINRIRVLSDGRNDELIADDVQAALNDEMAIEKDKLQATVEEGRVTLTGFANSYAEKQLAETAIAAVRGVTGVDNRLRIRVREQRADAEIRPEILRRFELSPYLADGLIEVEVKNGHVKLEGAVGSLTEKSVATMLAWVAGVREVDDSGLEVQTLLDQHRRRDKITALRNDVQIRRAVEDALLYDPRVRRANIEVRVDDGAVFLIGAVSRLAAKVAAEQDANNTLGVRQVFNQLSVTPDESLSGKEVTRRVEQALARDAHLFDRDVRVTAQHGNVFLSGTVKSFFEKRRAGVIVSNVPGVREIENRIVVKATWQPTPDNEIKENLLRRFRWSPSLQNEQINVVIENGVVTLRGAVDTRRERDAAERHARQAGARKVVDQLHVRSGRMTPVGLKASVSVEQKVHSIARGQSGESFRDFLKTAEDARDYTRLPPPPKVDLALQLQNTSDQPIDIRIGHDSGGLELMLVGEGAVHFDLRRSFPLDFHTGEVRTIEPDETFVLPIRSLQYGFRNATERWYWTEPGEYTLHVTLTWPRERTGLFGQYAVTAAPVKLSVKIPAKPTVKPTGEVSDELD